MTSRDKDSHKCLLVLASTYPRWVGDPEPGFVHELCLRLAADFNVVVVCPNAPGALVSETMHGVRVERFRYAPRRWQTLVNDGGITANLRRKRWKYFLLPGFLLAMFLATRSALRKHNPSIIHAHWLIPQGLMAAFLSRREGKAIPFVATSHGADLYAWNGSAFGRLKRFVVRRATTLTVVSQTMIASLARLGANPDRIELGPMGVDIRARFTPVASVQRSRFEILFVGRLVEKKGLKHLIAVMPAILARFPEAKLTIVGFGPEELERKRQVASLGVQSAVEFLGAISQDRLPSLYSRAAMFVAPFVEATGGDRDGLGLVAVEAAACGCPVVVSDLPAIRDVFSDGEATFVVSGDRTMLVEAIIRLMADPGAAPLADRSALMRKFDWTSVAANYRRIFAEAQERAQ